VDAGPGHDADRPAVPCPVHAAGTSYLLHRIGYTPQVPVHRAAERDEAKDRRLAEPEVGQGTRLAAATGAWICFEDEAGQNLRPPKALTWARRGHTPVVTVCGKGSGRVSVAGLVCLRPGARGQLFYRVRIHRGRKSDAARCPKPTTPA